MFCIILTSYVNQERKDMYLERIKKWLKTGIDIYLVDSNNQGFILTSSNYNQFLFDQSKEEYYKKYKNNSTHLELKSILKIVEHFKLTEKYDFIYKITSKYYFDKYNLLYDTKGFDIICQCRRTKTKQNSELVGFKSDKIIDILNFILKVDKIFEEGLNIIKNAYVCKNLVKIKLKERVRRGNRSILTYL